MHLSFISLTLHAAQAGVDPSALKTRLKELEAVRSSRLAPHAPEVPESDWLRAIDGDVVTGYITAPGSRARIGWGVAVFDVNIERMWAGLNDELQHQALLGLGHVELISGQPCTDGRKVMMLLPLPLVSDRWWVVENRYNTALAEQTGGRIRELTWQNVDSPIDEPLSSAARAAVDGAIPVAFNVGAWLLVDLDGSHTLAEYHAWTDPGGDLPAGAASAFANASIASTMRKMSSYAREAQLTCL